MKKSLVGNFFLCSVCNILAKKLHHICTASYFGHIKKIGAKKSKFTGFYAMNGLYKGFIAKPRSLFI